MVSQEINWIVAYLAALFQIILNVITPIVYYIYGERPPRVPPPKNPLLKLSACTIAKKIRLQEISSREVVEAYIERIKEVNPIINAVVEERFEAALKEAVICDENIKDGKVSVVELEKTKPFYGIPLTIKEVCAVKGMSYTGGSLIRKGVKALEDGETVELMKNAGGIVLCVTNTAELCMGFDSSNYLAGRTCNAYDTRCTAGGSSGGEGTIIGTGSSIIGIGSDIAGSIRIPAHFNGIFGHKPTTGIVSAKSHYPYCEEENFKKFLVLGPMARYMEDLCVAMKVITANCDRNLGLDDPVDLKQLRVFYLEDIGDTFSFRPTTPEIQASINKAAMHLKDCGSSVNKYTKDSVLKMVNGTISSLLYMKEYPIFMIDPDDPKKEKKWYWEVLKSLFGLSKYTKSLIMLKFMLVTRGFIKQSRHLEYKAMHEEISKDFIELLGNNGVFIIPTFPIPAPVGKTVCLHILGAVYCAAWNINGFPSTHVPMGLNKDGLPFGFQVIAAPYQDRLCLAVAKELEKQFGGWIPPYSS